MSQSSARSFSLLNKCLIAGFISLAIGGFALEIFLGGYYCQNRPTTPQPLEGRVVRVVVCHRTVVYLTSKEYLAYEVIVPAIFITSFGVGGFFHWKIRGSS